MKYWAKELHDDVEVDGGAVEPKPESKSPVARYMDYKQLNTLVALLLRNCEFL